MSKGSRAASELAARRWAGTKAAERSEIGRKLNEIRWERNRSQLHLEIIERLERGESTDDIVSALGADRKVIGRLRRRRRERINVLTTRAIAKGELVRPSTCSECQQVKRVEAHHDDYTRAFDVRWLCVKCHRALHRPKKGAAK